MNTQKGLTSFFHFSWLSLSFLMAKFRSIRPKKLFTLDCRPIHGCSVDFIWGLGLDLHQYREQPGASKKTIRQIDRFLDFLEFNEKCFTEGSPEWIKYFYQHYLMFQQVTDEKKRTAILIEVMSVENDQCLKAFLITDI